MSQVEWAEALQPTVILLGIRSNDTLGAGLEAVDLCPIIAADPLVNPGVSYPLSALGSKTRGLLNTPPD